MGLSNNIDLWLIGICLSRVGTGLALITYAAALPVLQREWGMSAATGGSISTANQIAYAVSLVIFSSLADLWGAKRVYLGSMTAGAVSAVFFALFARDYYSGLILYSLVGLCLGGSYTTGLMILSERYATSKRGMAMGFFIASTSAGYTLSLLISGLALPLGGYKLSFFLTCLGTPIGAAVAWLALWRTKNTVVMRQGKRGFVGDVVKNKPAMLLIAGYCFHNWELQGMWTWTPAFLAACFAFGGAEALQAAGLGSYASAFFHFTGILASFSMGLLSDRRGRAVMLLVLSGISSICSFLFGWTFGWPLIITIGLGAIYAFSSLGDSPVLSAALSEAADPAYLGAALGLRSLLGFSAGAAAPLVFGLILDWTNPAAIGRLYAHWGWAFSSLGLLGLGAVVVAFVYKRQLQSRNNL
ncbi:MAG: MFS transporter [Deltaproteobacteria bacterium]|nr:MFS transporter [Deltaproteobacteria bacterium]